MIREDGMETRKSRDLAVLGAILVVTGAVIMVGCWLDYLEVVRDWRLMAGPVLMLIGALLAVAGGMD